MLNFPTGRVEVCHVTVPIPNLCPQHHGLRLIQLSDFHFEHSLNGVPHASHHPQMMSELVWQVRSLQPDLIVYTGDFINGDHPEAIEILCGFLQKISGRMGNFAVLGNHDSLTRASARQVTHHLEQSNIQVLQNEVCYPCGPGLAIVGFACLWQDMDSLFFDSSPVMNQIPLDIPKIVLAHSPQFSEFLTAWPIELQLSGHTHGGQLALPVIGPLIPLFWRFFSALPRRLQQCWFAKIPQRIRMTENLCFFQGRYAVNQGVLYVNRGIGSHRPGRLFCRPEITVITLLAS